LQQYNADIEKSHLSGVQCCLRDASSHITIPVSRKQRHRCLIYTN